MTYDGSVLMSTAESGPDNTVPYQTTTGDTKIAK